MRIVRMWYIVALTLCVAQAGMAQSTPVSYPAPGWNLYVALNGNDAW